MIKFEDAITVKIHDLEFIPVYTNNTKSLTLMLLKKQATEISSQPPKVGEFNFMDYVSFVQPVSSNFVVDLDNEIYQNLVTVTMCTGSNRRSNWPNIGAQPTKIFIPSYAQLKRISKNLRKVIASNSTSDILSCTYGDRGDAFGSWCMRSDGSFYVADWDTVHAVYPAIWIKTDMLRKNSSEVDAFLNKFD